MIIKLVLSSGGAVNRRAALKKLPQLASFSVARGATCCGPPRQGLNRGFKSLNLKYRIPSKVTSAFELIDIKHLKICYCFLQANK